MSQIQILTAHVADLISAGEVVERPASVVKELMENAIDADAKAITVEIMRGGMSYIRVTDDGCGIPAAEAETAFLRHATSKIRTEYDLEVIGTLGFRGEALAAISAVARLELMTRTIDSDFGVALTLEGGSFLSKEEAGGPEGTTMIVRDLFFNTPARLKYMKKDAAEGAAVFATVQNEALAHPEVSVKFIRDGKQELITPGDGLLKSVVYSVLGRDLALGLLPVKGSGEEGLSVEGFASLPVCCRPSRGHQFFFVNHRFVKSRLMMAALEEAYRNQRMIGKFPACVLNLTIRLGTVDVNVHPAKTEVKFLSDKRVFDTVYHGVLNAIEGQNTPPVMILTPSKKPVVQDTVIPKQTGFQTMSSAVYRGKISDAEDTPTLVVHDCLRTEPPFVTEAAYLPPVVSGPMPIHAPTLLSKTRTPPVATLPSALSTLEASPHSEDSLPWVVRGEFFKTYILVEQGESAFLIDKHAAHERIHFDRFKAADHTPMMQQLLVPVAFTPTPEEGQALLEQRALLEDFGFEVEDFGGGALLVRQCPDYVDVGQIEEVLAELAETLLTVGQSNPEDARDTILATMACKSAIKGGQHNGPSELQAVAEAVMAGRVQYCPHGRPVSVTMTKSHLEKLFKRA